RAQEEAAAGTEAELKIRSAFEVFDHDSNNTVDVRETGAIISSLGCFPTQADLHAFIAELEEDQSGHVHLDKFLPVMTKRLHIYYFFSFAPASLKSLNLGLQVLDKEKKGHLEPDELTKYMTQEGEPFTQEEMEEMLTALVDPKKNCVHYKELIKN
uniref:EF-hand calcium binding domain 2 n=1 Tax=Kryptolebias marmoratus TaxID=37003 RepID=A0A3Q3BCG5_KRYMA